MVFSFGVRVSRQSPGCTGVCDPPSSASWGLSLQACSPMPSLLGTFVVIHIYYYLSVHTEKKKKNIIPQDITVTITSFHLQGLWVTQEIPSFEGPRKLLDQNTVTIIDIKDIFFLKHCSRHWRSKEKRARYMYKSHRLVSVAESCGTALG